MATPAATPIATNISQELLDALDATAKSLGPTPRYDSSNNVIPFGTPHRTSGEVFVVWHGRAIGLFYGLKLADAMVFGFFGAAFVGCRSLAQAQALFRRGPSWLRGVWAPPAPRSAIPTPGVALPDVSKGNYKVEDLAYNENAVFEGDLSDIRAQLHAPPSIPIIQSREANEMSRRRWESMQEQRNDSLDPQVPAAVSGAPSFALPSGISSGTVSWRAMNTPAISSWDSTNASRSARSQSTPTGSSSGGTAASSSATPRNTTTEILHRSSIVAWAVIRGLHPGVYQSQQDADVAAGYAIGMKVVGFAHKTHAFVYFVQKYMAGMVGCPVDVEE